jgi:hypothetical protein
MLSDSRCMSSLFLVLLTLLGCARPPELGSEEASRAAESLYTAVTSRRDDLLQQTESQISQLRSEQKLSEQAHTELTDIIRVARDGNWQPAAERLDALIRAQP